MRTVSFAALAVSGVLYGVACGATDDGGVAADPRTGLTGATGGGAMAGAGAGIDAGTTTVTMDPVTVPDAGSGITYLDAGFTGEKCVSTKNVAPPASNPKIDIVWIVDSSQSMFDEQKRINMNLAAFTNAIAMANLDVSISMVSQSPSLTGQVAIPLPGLCPDLPPDPLAGNPFQMDPRYHFVQTYVDSPAPLTVAISAYPMYSRFLREGSIVHFIIVTDDEARYGNGATADARAMQFQADMMRNLNRPFRVHTISSPGPTPCSSAQCELDANQGLVCVFLAANCRAANSGLTYYALAKATNGLTASICETDWTPIFKTFGDNIIKSAPLPCDYTIPPPPKGETLSKDKVNVGFTPPGGAEEMLFKVGSKEACSGASSWYYDNPSMPTKVLLCPDTCAKAAGGGAMNIIYGCNTVVLE